MFLILLFLFIFSRLTKGASLSEEELIFNSDPRDIYKHLVDNDYYIDDDNDEKTAAMPGQLSNCAFKSFFASTEPSLQNKKDTFTEGDNDLVGKFSFESKDSFYDVGIDVKVDDSSFYDMHKMNHVTLPPSLQIPASKNRYAAFEFDDSDSDSFYDADAVKADFDCEVENSQKSSSDTEKDEEEKDKSNTLESLHISTSPLNTPSSFYSPLSANSGDDGIKEEHLSPQQQKTEKQLDSIRKKRAKKKENQKTKKLFAPLNDRLLTATDQWYKVGNSKNSPIYSNIEKSIETWYIFKKLPSLQQQLARFTAATLLPLLDVSSAINELPKRIPCSSNCACQVDDFMTISYPNCLPSIPGVNDLKTRKTFINYDAEDVSTYIRIFLPELKKVQSQFIESFLMPGEDDFDYLNSIRNSSLSDHLTMVMAIFLRHPKLFLQIHPNVVRGLDTGNLFLLLREYSPNLKGKNSDEVATMLLEHCIDLGNLKMFYKKSISPETIKKHWQKVILVGELLSSCKPSICTALQLLMAKMADDYHLMGKIQLIKYNEWLDGSGLYEKYIDYQKVFNGSVNLMYFMRTFSIFTSCQINILISQFTKNEMDDIYLIHSLCKMNPAPFIIYLEDNINIVRDVLEGVITEDVLMVVYE